MGQEWEHHLPASREGFSEARGELQRSPPQLGRHREQVSDSDPGNPERRRAACCLGDQRVEKRTVVAAWKLAQPLRVCGSQECEMCSWAGGGPQARMGQAQAYLMSRPLGLCGGGTMTSGAGLEGDTGLPGAEKDSGVGASEEHPLREPALALHQA